MAAWKQAWRPNRGLPVLARGGPYQEERGDDCAMIAPRYRAAIYSGGAPRATAQDIRNNTGFSTLSTTLARGLGRADSARDGSAPPAFAARHAVSGRGQEDASTLSLRCGCPHAPRCRRSYLEWES